MKTHIDIIERMMFAMANHTVDGKRIFPTLKAAKEALKKQIPKKPLEEKRYYGIGKCPTCNAVFKDKTTNYCGNCGQAIDWSDVK